MKPMSCSPENSMVPTRVTYWPTDITTQLEVQPSEPKRDNLIHATSIWGIDMLSTCYLSFEFGAPLHHAYKRAYHVDSFVELI